MKKVIAIILILTFASCVISGCSEEDKQQKAYVKEAIYEIKDAWEDYYDELDYSDSRYLEIKDTRIIMINENTTVKEFQDVECIVEFVLLSDHYGIRDYYEDAGTLNNVVFYKDGTTKTDQQLIENYIVYTFDYKLDGIVDEVHELGNEYNQVLEFDD